MTSLPPHEPSPHRETTLHEILLALQAEAAALSPLSPLEFDCPLCRLRQRSVERSLRLLLAEFVNDPRVRVQWRQARGLCGSHTALLASLGDTLAIAILYADLAEQAQERCRNRHSAPAWTRRLRKRWNPKESSVTHPCPACLAESEAERRLTQALAGGLENPEVWHALETGRELCAPHTEQVAEAASPEVAKRLLALETQRLARLQAHLEEIIRKNDYRFRHEPWGEEKDAWLRALRKLIRPRE